MSPSRFWRAAQAFEEIIEPIVYQSATVIQGTHRKIMKSIRIAYIAAEDLLCSFIPWLILLGSLLIYHSASCIFTTVGGFLNYWPWWFLNTILCGGDRTIWQILRAPASVKVRNTRYLTMTEELSHRGSRWLHCSLQWLNSIVKYRDEPSGGGFDEDDDCNKKHLKRVRELSERRRQNSDRRRHYHRECIDRWLRWRVALLGPFFKAHDWLKLLESWRRWMTSLQSILFWMYASSLFCASFAYYLARIARYKFGLLKEPPP